ncbi:dihydrodipicolinate synthase family protein [Actinoplanes auranticolor]|uniref:4-hydroxy-tetrahydrodipicolinate synthase n=1 Tax=Actinoplanes auranticolor TaxID=47988 RepID=A0A919VPP0_9ACTN|nr:dihydrodipicolinate synthase family protein [Actinoplanes auranticolor]GIM71337.1 4-hydroxy-tetrahydrodipicolinate synthase [Actinoplanes auranticolor]
MTFTGVYVPLITPFGADGSVALDALESLARQVLADGAAGLVALGTTGEPSSLSAQEQRAVLDVVARVCRERDATLVIGANSVEAVRAVRDQPAAGAVLSLVPPFVRPGEAGVVAYFEALAAASPVPVLVYHVPYRTGQVVPAATLRRLAAIPKVAGVKLAAGGIDAATVELMADPPAGFAVLGGDDAFVSPLLALGAHGGILASAHVATDRFAELVRSWRAGNAVAARAVGHRLTGLALALFAEPNPTVIKGVLHAQGRIPTAAVRLPLLPAGAGSVEAALEQL